MTTTPTRRAQRPLAPMPAPRISSLKASNGPRETKPFVLPERPSHSPTAAQEAPAKRSLPARPPRLTVPKVVKNADGTETVEEKEVWIVEQDARIINHLVENGIATRKILAYLCGADERNVDRKMESLRKRLATLLQAGVLSTVGNDVGAGTTYSLTAMGRKFYSGSSLAERFIPDLDESTLLNLSSIVARISAPRSSSFFSHVPDGSLSVGLPVITASRIASDTEQMVKTGTNSVAQQQADLAKWLTREDYPTVGLDWSLNDFTAEQSDAIADFFHTGFKSNHGSQPWVMPGSLFQTWNEYGTAAQNLIPFVMPLPHIRYEGRRYMSAMACFVDLERQTDGVYQHRLTTVANSPVPFTKIACFIPDSQVGIGKALRENWHYLCEKGFVAKERRDDLLILPYEPVNAPNVRTSFASPDRPVPVKHFGRG